MDDGEFGPAVGPPIAALNGAVVWPARPVTHDGGIRGGSGDGDQGTVYLIPKFLEVH